MQSKNPFAVLQKESPQVSEAFTNLIAAVSAGGPDAKTRQLIFIGIKASLGDASAVAAHVPMAKNEGASREEILGAILMTLTVSGIQGITNCLIPALEAYERMDKAI
jgi:alkylhydroperoxidase/carboxymuconolactone decarboxylase family protein YurZ